MVRHPTSSFSKKNTEPDSVLAPVLKSGKNLAIEHAQERARQCVVVDGCELDVSEMRRRTLPSGFSQITSGFIEQREQVIGQFYARCHARGRDMANADGRTGRQLQHTTGEMIGPNGRAVFVTDDRYREIAIAAVPQPIPMPGPSIERRTYGQTHTDHQRARPLQHETLRVDSRPAVDADGTRFSLLVIDPITAEHVIGGDINHSRVSR